MAMTKPELSSRSRWIWIVAVALAAALPYALKTAADHDLWWHVKTGQMILEQRGLPETDPFSFTAPGASWTNHEWLSDVVLAAVYDSGGDQALSLLRAGLLFAAIAGFALLLWIRLPHPLFVLGGCLLVAPLFRVVNLRPHSYTYLFVVVLLLTLDASDVQLTGEQSQIVELFDSHRDVRAIIDESGLVEFDVEYLQLRGLKQMHILTRLPGIREFFTNRINCVLVKP